MWFFCEKKKLTPPTSKINTSYDFFGDWRNWIFVDQKSYNTYAVSLWRLTLIFKSNIWLIPIIFLCFVHARSVIKSNIPILFFPSLHTCRSQSRNLHHYQHDLHIYTNLIIIINLHSIMTFNSLKNPDQNTKIYSDHQNPSNKYILKTTTIIIILQL